MMYLNDINYCDMPCTDRSNCLATTMVKSLQQNRSGLFSFSLDNTYELSRFHTENDRSFHFPALECVGRKPKIALLGITKGRTQLDLALHYAFDSMFSTPEPNEQAVAEAINSRGVHAVFAGKQIRRNIGNLLSVIGVWDALGLQCDPAAPDRIVDEVVGFPSDIPQESFYIASLVKCALLTTDGKSDAPTASELRASPGAISCINRNLFRPFDRYSGLRIAILFGGTSFQIINEVKIDSLTLVEQFEKRGVKLIFLPHPSGANNQTVANYCASREIPQWCSNPVSASEIIESTLTGLDIR